MFVELVADVFVLTKIKLEVYKDGNFPFKSLDIAKLYLRTADYTNKKCCGIYEIENSKGRKSYKIFASDTELNDYLSKNKDKICNGNKALFTMNEYKEFNNTQIKHLSQDEVEKYLSEM